MAENKKPKRRSYLNDYKADELGKFSFQGIYYEWDEEPGLRKKRFITLWILCGAGFVLSVIAGCVDNPWVNVPYIIIPYAIGIVVIISLVWGMIRMSMEGFKLRSYVYEKSTSNLHLRVLFVILLTLASVICQIIAVFISGIDAPFYLSLLFILPQLIAGIMFFVFRKIFVKIKWTKKD